MRVAIVAIIVSALADNQRHPSLRQYLGGKGDGAELAVSFLLNHAKS
ncbi:MAG: hypothetical protein ACLQFW_14340 [Xanthobacteraceae bacterium]